MKILAKLTGNSKTISKDIFFYGTLEQAKERLYYVEYEGSYYEWVMYDLSTNGYYDMECHYCQVKGRPLSDKIYSLSDGAWAGAQKCECGSAALGHPGHSYWCKKFNKY
jgi:hypothetical protein